MGTPRKRFCVRGHDTLETGRYGSGRCCLCTKSDARQREREGRRTPLSLESKNKARLRESEWRALRPQTVKRYNQKYRQTAKAQEKALQYRRQWYAANRLHVNQKHAARMRSVPALSKDMVDRLIRYYGTDCVYCGGQATGFDHLHPVSREGLTTFFNMAPACGSCNSRKWSHPIWVMVEKGGDVSSCRTKVTP